MSKRNSNTRVKRRPSLVVNVSSDIGEAMSQTSQTSVLSVGRTEWRSLDNFPENLMNGLEVMWRQTVLCDTTLIVGSSRFRAHRVVLASCADFFHELLTEQTPAEHECEVELSLDGVTPPVLEILLECMYTGKIQINEANVRELLAASAYLKFYAIQDACADFLHNRLEPYNCLRMLNMAFTYNLDELSEAALKLAAQNFLEISDGFDYQQMNINQLLTLISRDDIRASHELDVFNRALGWIDYDKKSRARYAVDILQEIRLGLMSPSELVDRVEAVDYLMEIPECQRLAKEALHYHCLPARQSILQNIRTCPRSSCKMEVILATGGAPRLKSDPVSSEVKYYNPVTNTWGYLTSMKEPRHHHAVATLGGFLYIAGGEQTNDQRSPLDTAYRYDPRKNQWLQIASMKHRRESFQLATLAGMLYAVGGRVDQDISLAEVERYSPAVDKWESVAPISGPRRSVALAAHNGRLYAMGGSGQKRISSKVERYNPLSNQWESRHSLSTPRFFAQLASTSGHLYLLGGATVDSAGNVVCAKKVECYTPSSDSWITVSPLLEARAEAGCTVLRDKIYIIGGYSWDTNKRLNSAESYDISTDKWTAIAPISVAYTGVACCSIVVYQVPDGGKDTLQKEKRPHQRAPSEQGRVCSVPSFL